MRLDKIEYKSKTGQILEKGRAERGNFNPSGVPLKMYNYWLNLSESDKAVAIRTRQRSENFCHFWRVVAIWAPLWFIAEKVVGFFESTSGKVISTAVVVAALVAIFVLSPSTRIGFAVVAGVFVVAGLVVGLAILIDNHWPRKWNEPIAKVAGPAALGLVCLAGAGALILGLVSGFLNFGWIFFLWLLGSIGLAAGIVYGIACLSDYIAGIRADKKQKRDEFLDSMTPKEYFDYINEKHAPRPPGKIAKFFSGVGDFIVFVAQIVRVKKWKICPLVTIENNNG